MNGSKIKFNFFIIVFFCLLHLKIMILIRKITFKFAHFIYFRYMRGQRGKQQDWSKPFKMVYSKNDFDDL